MQCTLFLALALLTTSFFSSNSGASLLTLTAEESCESLLGTEAHDKLCKNQGLFTFSTISDQELSGGFLVVRNLANEQTYVKTLNNLKDLVVLRLSARSQEIRWAGYYVTTAPEVKKFLEIPAADGKKISPDNQATILKELAAGKSYPLFINVQSRASTKLQSKRYLVVFNTETGVITLISKILYQERF